MKIVVLAINIILILLLIDLLNKHINNPCSVWADDKSMCNSDKLEDIK